MFRTSSEAQLISIRVKPDFVLVRDLCEGALVDDGGESSCVYKCFDVSPSQFYQQSRPRPSCCRSRERSSARNTAAKMCLLLLLVPMLGTARAEVKSPLLTYTHTAAFQHRGTLWSADGIIHVRIPLELHFLESECQDTKTLLHLVVVKTTGLAREVAADGVTAQAEEVGDVCGHHGHHLWEVPAAAAGGALHRQVHYKLHGNKESQLCCSTAGCSAPA